jgi:pyruvate dehydrogenase E1 component beta subunit
MYELKGEVSEEEYTIPLGVADVKRHGRDVTVVAYAYMVPKSLAAAEQLAQKGIDVEVIDLRTIDPIDEDTIVASVKKTSRLVIVQETWRRCSVSSEVAAIAAEQALDYLDAPVIRVTGADVPVPAAPVLEDFVLPQVDNISDAVERVMSY